MQRRVKQAVVEEYDSLQAAQTGEVTVFRDYVISIACVKSWDSTNATIRTESPIRFVASSRPCLGVETHDLLDDAIGGDITDNVVVDVAQRAKGFV